MSRPAGERPFDVAVRDAAASDRVAWAFLAGYLAACRRLFPDAGEATCLAVTEEAGNRPRDIATRVSPTGRVTGKKTFVTMGSLAEQLFVLASAGEDEEGRSRLRLVRVRRDAPGVRVTELPPLPFVPEVPHAVAQLNDAEGEILPGDGWVDHVKPFRTVEDLHVTGAVLAFLVAKRLRTGRSEGPLLAPLLALRALVDEDPRDPAVHVGAADALAAAAAAVEAVRPDVAEESLHRDLALLGIAGKARRERERVARERLGLAPVAP